jgi:hypothetical protein
MIGISGHVLKRADPLLEVRFATQPLAADRTGAAATTSSADLTRFSL